MIITADTLTLSFLVVSAVTLAVVVVLIWYVYTTKKFREEIIKLMDNKLEMYLDNLETPKQEKSEVDKVYGEKQKDVTEFAEKREEPQEEEKPQSFVEAPPKVEEQPKNTNE